jgi:hypothetical protein
MTPTLPSIVIFVPSGSDNFWSRWRIRCAISGGAVIG